MVGTHVKLGKKISGGVYDLAVEQPHYCSENYPKTKQNINNTKTKQVLVGLRKQFMNKFVFPTWAGAAGFNNNDNAQYCTDRRCTISHSNTLPVKKLEATDYTVQ